MNCIFCRIIDRKVPAKIVYEDDVVLAFEDINPQAPIHMLIIPKKHIPTILEGGDDTLPLYGHMVGTARELARRRDIEQRGFRLVMNCNAESGQAVYHVHLHLLGGRPMHWPPG